MRTFLLLCVLCSVIAKEEAVKPPGVHLPRPPPESIPTSAYSHASSKFSIVAIQEDIDCGGCSGHGKCVAGSCVCDSGFQGQFCEKAVCLRNCGNHGQCIDGVCKCQRGWRGDDCLTDTCPNHCHGRGMCNEGRCECTGGWRGISCNIITTLKSLVPLPPFGQPVALIVDGTVVVRVPPRVIQNGQMLRNATLIVTIDMACASKIDVEAPKYLIAEQVIPVDFAGDVVLDKAPARCSKIESSAVYGTFFDNNVLVPKVATFADLALPRPRPGSAPVPDTSCVNNCSGHGKCFAGKCFCEEEWFGPCCCKRLVEDTREPQKDPLASEPGYRTFGGPPSPTEETSEPHVDLQLLQDDRFLQPAAQGPDMLVLLQSSLWSSEGAKCCVDALSL